MKLRAVLLSSLACLLAARADEGMWTFDNLPLAKMKAKYGFAPDEKWLEHVRLAAVNFGGGSGSFVSKDGLVITNHHVGRFSVSRICGPGEKDYMKLGFLAKTRAEELKVPMTVRTLQAMENVTAAAEAAVTPGMTDQQATAAKDKAVEAQREAMAKRTGLEVRAISLYQGGERWLYGYKVFDDVRLVFAPEMQAAFFGGDPDNFTFPRHDLDMMLFRIYENGKPFQPAHHLPFSATGVKPGDLTFVIGHPGRTQRQETFAQMRYARDLGFPLRVAASERARAFLQDYGKQSPEHARQVVTRIFGIENGLKATNGYWRGLKDAEAMAEVERAEQALRAAVAKDPELQALAGESWAKIEAALQEQKATAKDAFLVTTQGSTRLAEALGLVRAAAKGIKKDDGASKVENPELERFLFTKNLGAVATELPADHPFRKALLGDRTPEQVAELAEGSKVLDPAFRKALLEGGAKAVEASTDPLIRIARDIDGPMKAPAAQQEALRARIAEQAARIAKARFKVYGRSVYPDATGSLRLTYGTVQGFHGNGTFIQPFTTFYGLYDRALGQGPEAMDGAWALAPKWQAAKDKLNLATPFNFVHQVDIIGGNSGSPVVDTKGEFVGVIFDGNIDMLPGNFYYKGDINRGVTLDVRAIREALTQVYGAKHVVDELNAK